MSYNLYFGSNAFLKNEGFDMKIHVLLLVILCCLLGEGEQALAIGSEEEDYTYKFGPLRIREEQQPLMDYALQLEKIPDEECKKLLIHDLRDTQARKWNKLSTADKIKELYKEASSDFRVGVLGLSALLIYTNTCDFEGVDPFTWAIGVYALNEILGMSLVGVLGGHYYMCSGSSWADPILDWLEHLDNAFH